MLSVKKDRHVRTRFVAVATAAALTIVSLAACSSGTSSTSTRTAAGGGVSAAASNGASTAVGGGASAAASNGASAAVSSEVQTLLARYSKQQNAFTAPGPSLANVASLKGKTVFYIPIVGVVPYFHNFNVALSGALAHAGITVQTCDAQANPTTASACFNQAVSQNAAAVIVDSLPTVIAAQAVANVESHKIPMLLLNEAVPQGSPATVQGVGADQGKTLTMASSWIINDSAGKADVLVVKINDTAQQLQWAKEGIEDVYASQCPKCTIHEVTTKTADLQQQLPSLVSAALIQDPNIKYLQAQFDTDVPASLQGIQQAGRTGIQVVATTGGLDGLQRIRSGKQSADAGWDSAQLAWLSMDMVMRMMLKQPVTPKAYQAKLRLLDADNIKDLDVSNTGWSTGSWYGDQSYQATLLKLWGLS